jgi:formamidopyrimidine-DNA glycosylase
MPEGPECRIIGWRLGKYCHSQRILKVNIYNGRYIKPRELALSNIEAFNQHLENTGPTDVVRCGSKGKLIFIEFGNGWAMLSTMGLSGSWTTSHGTHCGVSLSLQDPSGKTKSIWFQDQLHYGTVKFVSKADLTTKLESLGPDVLDPEACTTEWWLQLCKRKGKWTLPKLLMDQSLIAGVGNYLKAEALYSARVSPTVPICQFSKAELLEVRTAALDVSYRCFAWKAYQAHIPGHEVKPPRFVLSVYNKGLDPQRRKVVRLKTTDGRVTHWVPEVQTLPGPQLPSPPAPASDV